MNVEFISHEELIGCCELDVRLTVFGVSEEEDAFSMYRAHLVKYEIGDRNIGNWNEEKRGLYLFLYRSLTWSNITLTL